MISAKPDYLPKASLPDIKLGVRASPYELGGGAGTNIQVTPLCP